MLNSFYHFGKDSFLNALVSRKKNPTLWISGGGFIVLFFFNLSEVRVELALKRYWKWDPLFANLKPPSLERAPEGTA